MLIDAAQELRQQLDTVFDVVHVAHLAGAVHVPQGQGQQRCDHAGAGDVEVVRVGVGSAHVGLDLVGDVMLLRHGFQQVVDLPAADGAVAEHAAAAQLHLAGLLGIHAGIIGGKSDVGDDGNVGTDGRADPVGTPAGGFFAHGGGGVNANGAAHGLCPFQGFQNDVGAAPVVNATGRKEAVDHFPVVGVHVDGVALLHVFPGVGGVLRTDVDVQLVRFQVGLVHVLAADDRAVDGLGIAVDGHLMAGVNAGENAAGFGHPEQAVGLDVGDDQTDLVDVGGKHHLEGCVGVQHADDVAGIICDDLVTVGGHLGDDLLLQRNFVAGNGHAVKQGVKEFFAHLSFSFFLLL